MARALLFLLLLTCANAYKILAIFPYTGKSHFITVEPMLRKLSAKGHDLTLISHFPLKKPAPKYRHLKLNSGSASVVNAVNVVAPSWFHARLELYDCVIRLAELAIETCSHLEQYTMQEFIKSKDETFDVVLIEQFDTDCYLGFVHKFKAPWIGVATHVLMPYTNDRFGGIDNPSFVPNHHMDYTDRMSFLERVENVLMNVHTKLVHHFFVVKAGDVEVKRIFGSDTPYLNDIAYNASLLLVNVHFTLTRPKPLTPNIIDISGFHIEQHKHLPKNIEKWINDSNHGVIYFSMGSMIRGHTFPEEKRLAFLKAFSRLKQRVLWKWETDNMPDQPDNVMIQKWMPQFDILCHPNVKAFIGHGGLLGTTEAVHCGVPMLVMPQFGDQHTNAKALEASGGGVVLNFRDVTEESIHNALQTLLTPEFKTQAKELSDRFRDRPMPPLDTAIYWIEYVARHKGAHHMKTAAVGMPLYQYLLLDVIAFLSAILLSFLYISYKMWGFVCGKICGGSKTKNTAKSENNKKKTK